MKHIIKSFIRNYKKQKLIYSIIIGGFAVSLALLVLIVSFLIEERSVDMHLPHINRMYRITDSSGGAQVPKRIYNDVLNNAPEIESLCMLQLNGTYYEYENQKNTVKCLASNNKFLDVFSIEVIKGDTTDILQAKTDVLITEEFAQKVFGDKDPIGELIEFDDKETKEVRAVIATPQGNNSLKYEVVFNLEQEIFMSYIGYNDEKYFMQDAIMVLSPSADPMEVNGKIQGLVGHFEGYKDHELKIQPFKEVYIDTKHAGDSFEHANINMIKLLSYVAIIILVLAIFNYVNLTTATNNERFKEISIRKTTGAKSKSIFYQFLGESYVSFSISLALSIGVAVVIGPFFKELFNREINIMESLGDIRLILAVGIIYLLIGALSGLIPALVVSKFNPIDLLQRKVRVKNSILRGSYNTIQIAVTVTLIVCLFFINKQINFVKTKDVGFNKELLFEVGLKGKTFEKAQIIKENLLKNPQVLNVSATHGLPFNTYSYGSGSWKCDSVEYSIDKLVNMNTDTSFLSTFDVKLVHGRNFRSTDKNACLINENTYQYLQFNNLENKTVWGQKVVGVVEDFHFRKMHEKLGYLRLTYEPESVSHLNIKISGNDIPNTIASIENVLKEFEPTMDFEINFYDDWINTMYEKEEKQAKAIKIYSLMALFLSCLGILGMAEFSSVKRSKEIGIRKVNGARISEVLIMLNRDFVKWVVIAFLIATPTAYYAMNKWLENFAYKTELSWWIFALAGFLALGIALLTVTLQSWKVATRNPVEALKYE